MKNWEQVGFVMKINNRACPFIRVDKEPLKTWTEHFTSSYFMKYRTQGSN